MLGDLDRVLDPGLRAGRSWQAEIDEGLDRWPRLAEISAAGEGSVLGRVRFDLRPDGSALLDAELRLEADVVCQRCLRPMRIALPVLVRMALGEETGAPEGYEAYGQVGGVSVRQLLEDELLLEVPGFPVHPGPGDCGPMAEMIDGLAPDPGRGEKKTNPFAALASLKTRK